MIQRQLSPSWNRSFFLFGARGTGKSTFLRSWFVGQNTLWLDLLSPEVEDRYARRPDELADEIKARPELDWVVVDEVQKVPKLLDVVHQVTERGGPKFALTGSSARKLKRNSVNLLAGRAFVYHLFPFTYPELSDRFSLLEALECGTLPGHLELTDSEDKKAFLRAYALTYLKAEVWGEQIIRKLDPFRNFLEVSAQCNGEIINYSNIARDIAVDTKTVQSYYQILEDTLLGFTIESYHKSIRKRQIKAPKFYFFDPGVKRALDRTLNVELRPGTFVYGKSFEHFVVVELIRRSSYLANDYQFFYLKTKDGMEIDLIVERPGKSLALVEIKSKERVDDRDVKTVARVTGELEEAEAFCLSLDPTVKMIEGVLCHTWNDGIDRILD